VQEQVDGQRDRLREDQRRGGSRDRRQGQSRGRVRYDSASRYDLEDEYVYGNQELSHDGGVTVQYTRPQRPSIHDRLTYADHVLEPRVPTSSRSGKDAHTQMVEGTVRQNRQIRRTRSRHPNSNQHGQYDKVNHEFVSFYFTNVPHDISYISLRQGFELC